MENSEISLLSPVSIAGPEGSVRVESHLRRGLLAILAIYEGEFIDYEFIQNALWDNPPASARSNIRTHLSQIKKDFGAVGGLGNVEFSTVRGPRSSGGGGAIKLYLKNVHVDLHLFENQCIKAHETWRSSPELAAELCKDGLEFEIRAFGADLPQSHWFDGRRSWLISQFESLSELSCRVRLLAGEFDEGLLTAQRLHSDKSLRGRSWDLLISALYFKGFVQQSLEYIEKCRSEHRSIGMDLPGPIRELQKAVLKGDADFIRSSLLKYSSSAIYVRLRD